ncbi:MAG TPA: hypothetical protein VFN67_17940 [Polyangiales bacterium]|nr:hypothetical protein [Polyangiales bacterium]
MSGGLRLEASRFPAEPSDISGTETLCDGADSQIAWLRGSRYKAGADGAHAWPWGERNLALEDVHLVSLSD